MPRLLGLGHVTWDRREGVDVLGGTVAYAALAARKLGWQAAVATSAGPELDPERDLPGVSVFWSRGRSTTRFRNAYEPGGTRQQLMTARADDVDLGVVPEEWREPDALLLAPVAGEVGPRVALGFGAEVVGAAAQGWLRGVDAEGRVYPRVWEDPAALLAGVHVLFLSRHDLPRAEDEVPALLGLVPIVILTRGWEGLTLHTRQGQHPVPSLPRPEVDPTGAGDVFAAGFLLRYHETGDPLEAAAFAACAASCVVEGVGASSLGDRAEVERRLVLRERMIEDGEWEE
jgi:sugar/nucleoside kinase (ribokinase family)